MIFHNYVSLPEGEVFPRQCTQPWYTFNLALALDATFQTRKPTSFWELPEGITWSSGGSGGKGLLWNAQINIKFMLPCHQGLAWGLEWGHVTYHVSGLLCHNCQTFQSKAAARNQFCDILGFHFRTYFLDILGFHFGNPIFRHFRLPFREPICRPQKAMPNCACCTARTIRHHRRIKMKSWWNLPSLPSGKLT